MDTSKAKVIIDRFKQGFLVSFKGREVINMFVSLNRHIVILGENERIRLEDYQATDFDIEVPIGKTIKKIEA